MTEIHKVFGGIILFNSLLHQCMCINCHTMPTYRCRNICYQQWVNIQQLITSQQQHHPGWY